MSILTKADFDNHTIPADRIETDRCFYCGGGFFDDPEHSTGGIVLWMGEHELCLHQPCAEELGVKLIQDARSLAAKVRVRAKPRHDPPTEDKSWYTR